MSDSSTKTAPSLFPVLRYQDGARMLDWLGEAFGFRPGMVVPGEQDSIAHAELALGNGVLMMGSGPATPDNPWSQARYGVYVHVEDVDAHCERARAAGAEIFREPADTDYGAREYSCRDPEGNLWSFGTYRPQS